VHSLSRQPSDALIIAGDTFVENPSNRRLIVELTAANRLPTVYGVLSFASEGGLICYGVDQLDPFRRAASYVDRILKGEETSRTAGAAADQISVHINLKTAKALGLDPSATLVAAADEVIEIALRGEYHGIPRRTGGQRNAAFHQSIESAPSRAHLVERVDEITSF